MANHRLSMRKITEVLRLYFEHSRSKREIARIIGVSPTTVTDYLSRAKLAGLSYPLPSDMDELALERRLFPPNEPSAVQRPAPDWAQVHANLRRNGVTLDLLWQEYKADQPDGFQYSAFCEHYRRWRWHLSLSMRQTHTPGERLFIDYAGPTVEITDMHSGEVRQAHIFVAVLGASNYTYIGAYTETLVERLLHQRCHPQQAFRSCLGVLQLGRQFGIVRLEAACARALKHNVLSWKSLQSILKHGLDQQVPEDHQPALNLPEHENVRGAAYYQSNLNVH